MSFRISGSLLFFLLTSFSASPALMAQACPTDRAAAGRVVAEGTAFAPKEPQGGKFRVPKYTVPPTPNHATASSGIIGGGAVDTLTGSVELTVTLVDPMGLNYSSYDVGNWDDSVAAGGPRFFPSGPENPFGDGFQAFPAEILVLAEGKGLSPEEVLPTNPADPLQGNEEEASDGDDEDRGGTAGMSLSTASMALQWKPTPVGHAPGNWPIPSSFLSNGLGACVTG